VSQYSIGAERYRLGGGAPAHVAAAVQASSLQALATPAESYGNEAKIWHPANPLFAFGVVAAFTFGLMAVSTSGSVRVGKAVASVGGAVGSTK
jgi:hypothetical protein